MEAENGLVKFAETIASQVHDDIADAVDAGELPEGALESVDTHKLLISTFILDGAREMVGTEAELDYEHIEMVARHASENAIHS